MLHRTAEIPTEDESGVSTMGGLVTEGVSRRSFLRWVAASGTAVVAACEVRQGLPDRPPKPWVKNPAPFIQHATNLESRLDNLPGFLTPNDHFFVRNHAPTPTVTATTYRLRVEGDGVQHPLELGYDEILRLPSRSVIAYLECAGNWRSFFARVLQTPARGGQWGTGGVGCAAWTGTPLATVLALAGILPTAVNVNLFGVDDGAFNRPMSIAKALDPDTILAHTMNGAPLPPDHGFPLRAVVPGWAGSNSVKWVGRIVVSSQPQWVKNNTTSYVLEGPEWPKDQYAPASGAPITTLNIKSALALPWPAALRPGLQRIRGFAYSPHGRVAGVQWRVDRRGSWRRATVLDPVLPRAWARFEFVWDATAGSHTLSVRATDQQGNTQPDAVPFNEKGYLLNIPLPHPVEIG